MAATLDETQLSVISSSETPDDDVEGEANAYEDKRWRVVEFTGPSTLLERLSAFGLQSREVHENGSGQFSFSSRLNTFLLGYLYPTPIVSYDENE